MTELERIDSNMKTEHTLAPEKAAGFDFYDVEEAPFSLHGVFREGECLVRLPKAVAASVSQGVESLYNYTTGGRVRFVTDSREIAIVMKLPSKLPDSRNALTAITGLDLYADDGGFERYFGTFNPPLNYVGGFEGVFRPFPSDKLRSVTINLPRANTVYKMYVGIEKGSQLLAAEPFREPPVVYYGSSITQGGCSSRPGTAYYSIVHRHINYDYINLGFSGNARGEDEIIDYISALDMSMFVFDYDHNAPNVEHLRNTHYKGYKKIRDAHPNIPILLLSRPKYYLDGNDRARLEVIRETYNRALAENDSRVYLIEGPDMIDEEFREESLGDHCHPTDCGFLSMARHIIPVMKEALALK